ncbi:Rieske (2Fe-2S) protein [Streptacidiphilus sp. N1-3]|uniref:Rieske (2Fe-2S) protein n=1 Tax=Streptacidiphilus alkalitolerans TaxID=3342712 RepID=A0ABV6X0L5_9ACTN
MKRPIDRYVDSLLRRRRPRPFAPTEEDLAVARTAIALAAAGPEAQHPREAFVEDLRRRLAARAAEEARSAEEIGAAAPPSRPRSVTTRWTMGRRRFLAATAVTASAAAGAAGYALTQQAPAVPAEAELTPTRGAWQAVAAVGDLPEGAVLPFDLGTVTGFVRRVSGRVQAVSGSCTHQGCRLQLTAPQDRLACPCHGATFALNGEPLTHPHSSHALAALPRLPVRVQEDSVQIYAPVRAAEGDAEGDEGA